MRIAKFVLMVLVGYSACQADELSSTAEAERQANIDAANERAEELRRVLEKLESQIARSEARGVPPGKRAGERSEGKIVNGVSTSAYPTAGAVIQGASAGSAGSWCTGTLIGSQTFLTAAHCVEDDPTASNYHVFLQHGGIFAVAELEDHPDYLFPHADLAVMRLESPVTGITPTAINTVAIANGSAGDIVGYGRAGGFNQDYGIKRAGSIQTAPCDPRRPSSLICWNFDDPVGDAGLDSNTCNADSGGPLYMQLAADQPLTLVGVTSGGTLRDCLAGDHSYDVDVQQFALWIEEQANGDLGGDAGELPAWGSDKVTTLSAETEFTSTQRERVYTFDVPAETAVLRVAMNGHDEGNRNFNLYVKTGMGVTTTDNNCAQDGSGQYAYCEFEDPREGTWSVLLDAVSGNGVAQVSATLFGD